MTRAPLLLSLLLLAFAAGGCALVGGSPPERYGGRATLTQAAQEAAKDSSEKHRRLDVGDEAPPSPDVGSGGSVEVNRAEYGSSSHATGGGADDKRGFFGLALGGGSFGGQEYEGFGVGGLDLGGYLTSRWRVDLGLLVLSPNLTATSVAGQGLKGEFELVADLSARYYLTPSHTFMAVYPLGGMRFGTLFWSYRKPVNVIADGGPKTISDDYLNYFGLYGGLGVSLVQTRHFSTGFNLTSGFRAYDDKTFEGFRNTLFPTTGYTQLGFEVIYRF